MTVWNVFASVTANCSHRVAIEVQHAGTVEQWTYRELHTTACAEARRLQDLGLRPGDRCAILADNDAPWCAAYLAILQSGAIVVPLDTNYSAAQIGLIVADATPRILLVNERLETVAREALRGHRSVTVERLGERAVYAAPPAEEHRDPAATAAILYTSGTSSDAKGVVLTHANLLAARAATRSVVHVTEDDCVLGVLPLSGAFAQVTNLLLPFAVGARVVFLEMHNSTEWVRALAERRITVCACAPQFFYLIHQRILHEARGGIIKRTLLRASLALNVRLRRLGVNIGPVVFARVRKMLAPQLRLLITGGATFDRAVSRDLYALGFTVRQAYGLTETSGIATITSEDEAFPETVGRVLPGQELRILPPAAPELDGEIAIRGPIVMRGYHNKPEATAAVLREGWLLTGDLGRLDGHGRLTITGRSKEVFVLASGQSIYPEEIESQYRRSAYVQEICVMGAVRPDDPTTERLFAVVVPNVQLIRDRRIVNVGDLLRFEMEGQSIYLPAHQRVAEYELWFEPLPRTTTGTLKRHEIKRRVRERHRLVTLQPPAPHDWGDDKHAGSVAAVIARRAGGRAVTPTANLELDLGFDSMERVELLAELEHACGVRVGDARAHEIVTVSQVIEALRSTKVSQELRAGETSWAALLSDLPTGSDPRLTQVLRRRRASPLLYFALLRILRFALPPLVVRGQQHLPPNGPFIISPNHQSFLDPFVVCSTLPYRAFKNLFFVGASEYFETPLTAWAARQFNLVPVDPDTNLVPAMRAAACGLTRGRILVLFPEGERSIDGSVKRFKKGAPILSRHLGVPVVPVAIRGVFELWPRNRRFNWRLLLPGAGHRVHVLFGEPMRFDERMTYGEAAAALRERVARMWTDLDQAASEAGEPRPGRDNARQHDA